MAMHTQRSPPTLKVSVAAAVCFVCRPGVLEVLPSLLAWDPTQYGLPAFSDLVESVIPLDHPFHIRGKVVKGFGRGSKVRVRACTC